MICDAHIHYIPEELSVYTGFYKGPWCDRDKLFEYLDVNKIEKALLVYPSTDAHLKLKSFAKACEIYNNALESIFKQNKNIAAAASVDIEDLSGIAAKVNDFKERGFKALSIASSHNGRFLVNELEPLFEAAEISSMPIFVHPQTINPIGYERIKDPLLMPVLEYSFDSSMFMGLLMTEGVLSRHNVSFIFSSLGGVMPFLKERLDRVYSMLLGRGMVKNLGAFPSQLLKNVYVETSGASLKTIQLALDLFGADRLLWGSDYPVCSDIGESLAVLRSIDSQSRDKILFNNFNNLFK